MCLYYTLLLVFLVLLTCLGFSKYYFYFIGVFSLIKRLKNEGHIELLCSYLLYITLRICSNLESLGSTCWLFLADTCIQQRPCKYSLVWNISWSWYSCSVQSVTKSQSTHKKLCWHSRVALFLLMERDIFCLLTSFLWICNKNISFLLEFHFKLFRKNLFFPPLLCWWIWWGGLLKVLVQNWQEFQQLQIIFFALLSVSEST